MSEGSQAETLEDLDEQPESVTAGGEADAVPIAPLAVSPLDVGIASGLRFRVDERFEVYGDAEVMIKSGSLGTTLLRGSILDISATGCYIQTTARAPIKPGTEVHIIFMVSGTTFRVDAASRFAKKKVGIGFRFQGMDEITRRRLRGILADIRAKITGDDPNASVPVVERMPLD